MGTQHDTDSGAILGNRSGTQRKERGNRLDHEETRTGRGGGSNPTVLGLIHIHSGLSWSANSGETPDDVFYRLSH